MDEEISQRQPEVGFLAQANTCAISCSVSHCASLSLCIFVSQCVVMTVSLWLDFCPSIPPQVLCPCLCYALARCDYMLTFYVRADAMPMAMSLLHPMPMSMSKIEHTERATCLGE